MSNAHDQAARFWAKIAELRPDWSEAHEKLGDALLDSNNFDQGIAAWRNAIAFQPGADLGKLGAAQLKDWWSSDRKWDGAPPDRYPALYAHSVKLMHDKHFDAHLDILQMGIEMQESFAQRHELDRLGICFLREWTYAIGHMALLDLYVKMGILGLRRPYRPIILDPKPANRHYLEYWRKYIPSIITDPQGVAELTPLAERLEDHLHLVTFADMQRLYHVTALSDVEAIWRREKRAPLLQLTPEDREFGAVQLKHLGVPQGAWVVGLHARSTNHPNSRNSSIESYRMAIESIAARGGWVLRMGDPSMPAMPAMPNTIDYVHTAAHSERMDVYLWAASRFFIGTNSGPIFVPPTFGVPCVVTNNSPIMASAPLVNSDNIGIYKLYRSEAENRPLAFAAAFSSPQGMSERVDRLADSQVSIVDNSAEEINEVVVEMLDRLEGKITYSDDDNRLQQRFKAHRPQLRTRLGYPHGRLGRAFLQKYRELV